MSNSSILYIDRTLFGATFPGQSRAKDNGNEGIKDDNIFTRASEMESRYQIILYRIQDNHYVGLSYPPAEPEYSSAPS